MSAIAGIFHSNKDPIPNDHSTGMMHKLQKFPADDVQIWQQDNIFLGCHAQWITSEQIGETLPYYDVDRKMTITADAIIDNREELFDSLQVNKNSREHMPDSQLILLAYQKWGDDSPKYLVGNFAYMIWDEDSRRLFGATDFSGSRTLYFYKKSNKFAFCTTIQPLFSLPYINKVLNEQWLADFLAIPEMINTVDPFSTVYKNIEQVPGSHSISVCGDKIKLKKYCNLTTENKLVLGSNEEYEEAFRDVFGNAVKSNLRTHRKVGAQLSGGLDSGSVVGFAAKHLKQNDKQLHTYSYVPIEGFVDWTPKSKVADERPFIQSTVKHVGNINSNYLSFPEKSPFSEIDNWLEILEMPYKFFENSYWLSGIYGIAEKQGMGILLNGARGNYTISWGSSLDYYTKLFKRLQWMELNKELKQYIYIKDTGRKAVLSRIGKKSFPTFTKILDRAATKYTAPIIINPEFAKRTKVLERIRSVGMDETWSTIPTTYELRQNQFQKLCYWGKGTSSTKLSLKHSLWYRDPTNDLRVVRFCLSLPDSQYIQNGIDRSLIRRATNEILPDKVRLNHLCKGAQGVDGIQRMLPYWNNIISELEELTNDLLIAEYINIDVIKTALLKIKENPEPELIFDPEFKILMRSLIVYKFIKKNFKEVII
ncbi:asparagine synthase-related protein [Virgibacillus flavescens]|uniref:asparagine synthase-related protein n=1 Tax=Virgibacillus flavescens TaxID=1611422 RepID=UPI003D335932